MGRRMVEWTSTQCAAYWGVKRNTWHGYVSRRSVPQPVRHIGRTPLWSASAVRKAHEARERKAGS